MRKNVNRKIHELPGRAFIKTSAVSGSTSLGLLAERIFAAGTETMRIGLIGCDGRGTGAVTQALMFVDRSINLWDLPVRPVAVAGKTRLI
ncbi:MAG: hypothetical protein JW837_04665 [Sedimentisphaerales bacterium]|nr:hypothetical protein [Sedimentisphaerales bacterium]